MEIKKFGWGFGACNQQCKHCYNVSRPQAQEYTFAQLKGIADKVCPQITDINYGTGEFFVNPNTVDLCEYIADTYPHVAQAVTSNGSTIVMMRPEKVGRLFHDVDISLDFPDEKKHYEFRRHPMAWKWVIEALEVLRDQDVPRNIVTCVTSLTTDEDIAGLVEIARRYDATWRINWNSRFYGIFLFYPRTKAGGKRLCSFGRKYLEQQTSLKRKLFADDTGG